MQLSLQAAATAAGKAKSTVQRAIKSGKLSATRNEDGSYSIDAAELSRIYVLRTTGSEPAVMRQDETAALRVKVEMLERQAAMLADERNDLRRRLDASDEERRRLLMLLGHQAGSNDTGKGLFRRLFG